MVVVVLQTIPIPRPGKVGCPAMGRKADVAVARAKARAVGIMVAGWEGSGGILVAGWEILG
jgi:hypothetical protein